MMLTTLFKVSLTQQMIKIHTCLKYMPLIKRLKNLNLNSKKNHGLVLVSKIYFNKNSIFKKYSNKKDPHIKEELHQKIQKLQKYFCHTYER